MFRDLLASLTLEEKASLCAGADMWHARGVERLGLPSWMMTDGPHGLRKQKPSGEGAGLFDSVPATCFPPAANLAATWNRDCLERVGRAVARECLAEDVGVILGPGVNIKRSPLCGRNFEYFSEDPLVAGELAAALIEGCQAEGVGTSLKHFAANNQEKYRLLSDSVVDERTLREIYLPAFEIAVRKAAPWTVMCAYNRVNGTYASENRWLLTEVLRDEWGFDGVLMTDWGACNDRVAGLEAGQDLEMPGPSHRHEKAIVEAVREGRLSEAVLDRTVERLLALASRVAMRRKEGFKADFDAHHRLAREVAAESVVLLKNENSFLPLEPKGKIAFIGEFAKKPRFQGGGSSHIEPTRLDDPWTEANNLGGFELIYAAGYSSKGDKPDPALIEEARKAAAAADRVVLFVGLTDRIESEGYDRTHLDLPEAHAALLEAVVGANPNVAVALSNGAPVAMPWLDRVPAVVEGYLGGQAAGGAMVDVLFGRVNPSGHLAETFPLRLEDTPAYLWYPGGRGMTEYREGVFVGYRHYETKKAPVLFPFGHGLSYTAFGFSNLRVPSGTVDGSKPVTVTVDVTNEGPVAGKIAVQLYVGDVERSVPRPEKELKAFEKVSLEPGERKTVSLTLDFRAWAFWSPERKAWTIEEGEFTVSVGASSADIRVSAPVAVRDFTAVPSFPDRDSILPEFRAFPVGAKFADILSAPFKASLGHLDPDSPEAKMAETMTEEIPLRAMLNFAAGSISEELTDAVIAVIRGERPESDLEGMKGWK